MKTIRFGIIGGGLMGREFASAALRWGHLLEMDVRPEIVAVCDQNPAAFQWYRDNVATAAQFTADYKELLANPAVEAVYVAVPHNLHREIYCAAIRAGKHLMGEKPFGIDLPANEAIVACMRENPKVFVRCSSQFPFYPGMQRMGEMIESGKLGRIIEASTGFLHSSDLDPNKPINWKRMVEFNGEYGVMGDLGMHACHVAFRAGWKPRNVRAVLSNIMTQRPDGKGKMVPCATWDNATLLCESAGADGQPFPWTLRTHRIAPGHKNTWYAEVWGTEGSVRWSSLNPGLLEVLEYKPGEDQIWQMVQTGYNAAFKTITGGNFEFGFTDAILQMWAAFLYELTHGKPPRPFAGCATPEEAALSHRLFTAALRSQQRSSAEAV